MNILTKTFKKVRATLLGYDVFISYSRSDSLQYAYALAKHFQDNGYEPFIDLISNTQPGGNISRPVIEAIKRSKGFVLIGSAGAQHSAEGDPIPQEIDTFLAGNGSKFLVPVNVDSAIHIDRVREKSPLATCIEKKVHGLTFVNESKEAFQGEQPSPLVLERIKKALDFTKKNARLRKTIVYFIAAATLLTIYSIWQSRNAAKATASAQKAQQQEALADSATNKAQKKLLATQGNLDSVQGNLTSVQASLATIQTRYTNTTTALKIAEKKNRIAQSDLSASKDSLDKLEDQKDSMRDLADQYKKEADHYQKVTNTNYLAQQAKLYQPIDPQLSVLLASYAVKQFEAPEAPDAAVENTFREIMDKTSGQALPGHLNKMRAVAINSEETLALSGDANGLIKLWDIHDRSGAKSLWNFTMPGEIDKLFLSTSTNLIIGINKGKWLPRFRNYVHTLLIWRIGSLQEPPVLVSDSLPCIAANISSDGKNLAIVDTTNSINIYSLQDLPLKEPLLRLKTKDKKSISSVVFNDGSGMLAANTYDSLAYVWRLKKDTIYPSTRISTGEKYGYRLRFSPDDRYLAIGATNSLNERDTIFKLYDLQKETEKPKTILTGNIPVNDLFFDRQSLILINDSGEIFRAGLPYQGKRLVAKIPQAKIAGSALSADGQTLIIGTENGSLFHFKVTDRQIILTSKLYTNNPTLNDIVVGGRGQFCLSSAHADPTPMLYDLQDSWVSGSKMINEVFSDTIVQRLLSDNRKAMLIQYQGRLTVVRADDPAHPSYLGSIPLATDAYANSFFSPDGNYLIVRERGGTGVYFIKDSLTRIGRIDEPAFSMTFSPDSRRLLVPEDSLAAVYSLSQQGIGLPQTIGKGLDFSSWDPSFSENGKWLIALGSNTMDSTNAALLWYVPEEGAIKDPFIIDGLYSPSKSVLFTPDSKKLFISDNAVSEDTSRSYKCKIYRLSDDGAVAETDSITELRAGLDLKKSDAQGDHLLAVEGKKYILYTKKEVSGRMAEWPVYDIYGIDDTKSGFSADGKWLFIMSNFGASAKLFKLEDRNIPDEVKINMPFKFLGLGADYFFSPNGRFFGLYSNREPTIFVYDLLSDVYDLFGKAPINLSVSKLRSLDDNAIVRKIAFSADGDTLYTLNSNPANTSSSLNRYRLSDNTGNPETLLRSPTAIEDFVSDQSFTWFLTIGKNVSLWNSSMSPLFSKAQRFVGRNFTLGEWTRIDTITHYQSVFDSMPPHYSFLNGYLENNAGIEGFEGLRDSADLNDSVFFSGLKNLDYLVQTSEDAGFCDYIGNYYLGKSEFDSAVQAYSRSVRISPFDIAYTFKRGLALGCLGKLPEALRDLQLFLHSSKNTSDQYKAEKMIQKLKMGEKLAPADNSD